MAVDLNRVLRFVGKDPNWINKIAIGAAVSLVPIVQFTAAGYAANLFRNVLAGREDAEVLPEWSDFVDHFFKGLFLFLIGLVYMIVPVCISLVAVVPTLMAILDGRGLVLAFGVAGTVAIICVVSLLSFVLALLYVMAAAMYIESGSLSDAFRLGETVRRITASLGDFAIACAIWVVGFMVASTVFGWIPVIGGSLTSAALFPMVLMSWYALGQSFRAHFAAPAALEAP